jgi:hypothetical protein
MSVATYLLVGAGRLPDYPSIATSAIVFIPFALGWWIAGSLRHPTPFLLSLAAIYWLASAMQLSGNTFSYSFSMGVSIYIRLYHDPKVSVDVLAICTAFIFFVAAHRSRVRVGASPLPAILSPKDE